MKIEGILGRGNLFPVILYIHPTLDIVISSHEGNKIWNTKYTEFKVQGLKSNKLHRIPVAI
jgi:hypothetical protein